MESVARPTKRNIGINHTGFGSGNKYSKILQILKDSNPLHIDFLFNFTIIYYEKCN